MQFCTVLIYLKLYKYWSKQIHCGPFISNCYVVSYRVNNLQVMFSIVLRLEDQFSCLIISSGHFIPNNSRYLVILCMGACVQKPTLQTVLLWPITLFATTHVPLSSVACPTLKYFSALSHKRHDFRQKSSSKRNVCCNFLYNFCLKYFSF